MSGPLEAVEDATEIWAMEASSWSKLNTWLLNQRNRVLRKTLTFVEETVSYDVLVPVLPFYYFIHQRMGLNWNTC